MGMWGPGLYANDFAKDLKATIGAVLTLPLEPTDLVSLIEELYPDQSRLEGEEDYTSFWLVIADNFHQSGINEPNLFKRATNIVDSGMDLRCPERQEMSESDRQKRGKLLAELRDRITKPPPKTKRKTLSQPQPLVLTAGDLFVYPVFEYGQCINPYSSRWNRDQKAWGAAYIVRSGHVFQYLAYYYPLVLASRFELSNKPSVEDLLSIGNREQDRARLLNRQLADEPASNINWELKRPGTCSQLHFRRLQIDILDHIAVDENKLVSNFPRMRDGRYQTVNNISISNSLGASPESDGTLDRLDDIVL